MVLNNCIKFHSNCFNGFQLTSWTRINYASNQMDITPKINKAELWFLCMTHRLIVFYNCMKYHINSLIVFNLQNGHKVSKGAKIRNRYNQVTNSQLDTINESQEVSPVPEGNHKAHINRR